MNDFKQLAALGKRLTENHEKQMKKLTTRTIQGADKRDIHVGASVVATTRNGGLHWGHYLGYSWDLEMSRHGHEIVKYKIYYQPSSPNEPRTRFVRERKWITPGDVVPVPTAYRMIKR